VRRACCGELGRLLLLRRLLGLVRRQPLRLRLTFRGCFPLRSRDIGTVVEDENGGNPSDQQDCEDGAGDDAAVFEPERFGPTRPGNWRLPKPRDMSGWPV
jgi:hypothetical protein